MASQNDIDLRRPDALGGGLMTCLGCGTRGYWCSRPGGHTGRHAFFWRFTGRLRAVWGEAA